ncbi:MAG: TMEM175 family protein [Chthoniobacterales bacterium]
MLWSARLKHDAAVGDGFRLRGREVSRLEGFSDAVFGFALTLLVVSLDVPRNFNDLINTMRGFPAFAVCFLLLALVWNSHYKFCRRYGLDDGLTRFLTCILLFLVLFYVYPLKFLFNLSLGGLVGGDVAGAIRITADELSLLLVIYGLGFAAVYGALLSLYLHAYRMRDALDLSALERLDSRFAIYRIAMVVAVGLIAALVARIQWLRHWGGFVYFLLFPVMRVSRMAQRRRRAPLLAAMDAR